MYKSLLPLTVLLFLGCSDPAQKSEEQTNTDMNTAVPASVIENEQNGSMVENHSAESTVPDAQKTAPAQVETTVKITEAAKPAAIDGAAVFAQKCTSCHGAKAEKQALGKSQIIAGWSVQQIKDALSGYQNGTYGKEMKAVMQGQAKGLSKEQIDALANYITTL